MTDKIEKNDEANVAFKLFLDLRNETDETRVEELKKFKQCLYAVKGIVIKKLTDPQL